VLLARRVACQRSAKNLPHEPRAPHHYWLKLILPA
jgi:hypothetical protein